MCHVIFHVWGVSWRKQVCETISRIQMLTTCKKKFGLALWLWNFQGAKFNTFLLQVCYGTAMEHRKLLNWSSVCGGINCCNIFFVHTAVLSICTAFHLVKIHLLFHFMLLIQWSVIISIFVVLVVIVFGRLKYIAHLFSEYMLTFMVQEPMKICVTN